MDQPLQILIVDDNEADVHWMEMTLCELRLHRTVTVLTDGEQAVNFILKRGSYSGAPEPAIIFLDMNLPRLTGVQVLEAIDDGRSHPVCVVTGSRLEQELVRARFKLEAQCYIVKPVDRDSILGAFACFDHLKPIADEIRDRDMPH